MKLEDYAKSGKYLKWQEQDWHNIALAIEYEAFRIIEPVFSDRHDSEQYEIPVLVIEPETKTYESLLATKSKDLLIKLLNEWEESSSIILRIHKAGTGFYTKWTVSRTTSRYDKASGKAKRLPAKKK